jgi:hypothetical protein
VIGGVNRNKMKRTGGRAKTSRDVRHRMRYALKIGPRRNHLSYPHACYIAPSRRTANRQAGKKRGRDSGNQVMSNAIYRSTLFPASGGGSSRERDECRRYFLLRYCYHLPFNDQTTRDRLLARSIPHSILQ